MKSSTVLISGASIALYEQSRNSIEYLFGDSIATMIDTSRGVEVTFTSGTRRTFDLVIGADGCTRPCAG